MSSGTLRATRGWITRCALGTGVLACASVASTQVRHFAPFGLSELHTDKLSPDSLIADPLSAGWEWQHVYPNVIDSSGKDWRLNTDNIVQLAQNLELDLVLTLWAANAYNGKSGFPTDTTAWKDSVSAVVERYDGDGTKDFKSLTSPVKFWHVEEELSWWGGEAASLITLLFIQIFVGNIILRHLMRANLFLVSVTSVFHAHYCVGLERVSFLEQLLYTLRIRTFDVGQSLQIS